ncbi:uncharacterized protein L199_004113 [Kwoniella botswanensis]|uniref:uncharacterized protein n=1 Tax=Kwoniella botswanensis TaxID=1268659 RepID=UPI00315DAB55
MSSAKESIFFAITMSRSSDNKTLRAQAENIRSLAIANIQGSEISQDEQDRKKSRLDSAYNSYCDSMGTDNERLSFRKFEQAVQSATGISVP